MYICSNICKHCNVAMSTYAGHTVQCVYKYIYTHSIKVECIRIYIYIYMYTSVQQIMIVISVGPSKLSESYRKRSCHGMPHRLSWCQHVTALFLVCTKSHVACFQVGMFLCVCSCKCMLFFVFFLVYVHCRLKLIEYRKEITKSVNCHYQGFRAASSLAVAMTKLLANKKRR